MTRFQTTESSDVVLETTSLLLVSILCGLSLGLGLATVGLDYKTDRSRAIPLRLR